MAEKENADGSPKRVGCLLACFAVIGIIVFALIRHEMSGGSCRMTLPSDCYDSPEAAAAIPIAGRVRTRLLPEDEMSELELRMGRLAKIVQGQSGRSHLERGPIRERVDRAIGIVMSMDPPPCAWRWDEVKRVVGRFGGAIPIVVPEPRERDRYESVPMAYALVPPTLIVNPGLAASLSDGFLANVIVHEATHGVVQRLVEKASWLSSEEVVAAQFLCGRFDQQLTHVHEGLATWNELRMYARTATDPKTRREIGEEAIGAIAAFDNGNPKPFAHVMAENLRIRVAVLGTGQGRDPSCTFPPILSGPDRGRIFIPNGIDDPLVHAFAVATRLYRDKI